MEIDIKQVRSSAYMVLYLLSPVGRNITELRVARMSGG